MTNVFTLNVHCHRGNGFTNCLVLITYDWIIFHSQLSKNFTCTIHLDHFLKIIENTLVNNVLLFIRKPKYFLSIIQYLPPAYNSHPTVFYCSIKSSCANIFLVILHRLLLAEFHHFQIQKPVQLITTSFEFGGDFIHARL